MNEKNSNKEILNGVYAQIGAFDNKANIAISVLSIAFALFVAFMNFANISLMNEPTKISFYIMFALFVISTVASIFSFVLVIKPRKKVSHLDTLYPNYYKDIIKMNHKQLRDQINKWDSNDTLIIDQIMINADICDKKHKWFCRGLIFLIPTVAFAISVLIIFII